MNQEVNITGQKCILTGNNWRARGRGSICLYTMFGKKDSLLYCP